MLPLYSKRHLSIDDQRLKLKNDGLNIYNPEYAKCCLIKYNYYRLSAYWYVFRKVDPTTPSKRLSTFDPDHTFEDVMQLYNFDKKLRELVFYAISDIETFLRTQLAYYLPSIKNDPLALYDDSLFYINRRGLNYSDLLTKIASEVRRASDEDFIQHYRSNYSNYPQLPFWVLTEILSFGNLRKIYTHLRPPHKKQINNFFNIKDIATDSPYSYYQINHIHLDSYLFLINKYRNICAHHGRLWNRKISDILTLDAASSLSISGHENGGLFALLIILARLLEPTGHAKEWKDSVYSLIQNFPLNNISRYTTLHSDWYRHDIWNRTI